MTEIISIGAICMIFIGIASLFIPKRFRMNYLGTTLIVLGVIMLVLSALGIKR